MYRYVCAIYAFTHFLLGAWLRHCNVGITIMKLCGSFLERPVCCVLQQNTSTNLFLFTLLQKWNAISLAPSLEIEQVGMHRWELIYIFLEFICKAPALFSTLFFFLLTLCLHPLSCIFYKTDLMWSGEKMSFGRVKYEDMPCVLSELAKFNQTVKCE